MEEREQDFASQLLQKLSVEKPWVPPRTWESIASESGRSASAAAATTASNYLSESTYDPVIVSETVLVRLALNALQGVKSAIEEIHKASSMFSLVIADRNLHRDPKLWHRSLSMPTLGKLLKSIGHSGILFSLLRKFVDYFLGIEKEESIKNRKIYGSGFKIDSSKDKFPEKPPFTLVNQAFAVAVRKILDGYICALNTIVASVEFRRTVGFSCDLESFQGDFSKITLLEIYLHSSELRTRIEILAHICGIKIDANVSDEFSTEDFSSTMKSEYNSFPRGADLLTYLYIRMRDGDPMHHLLLKFLFLCAYEPYSLFIRSWIFKGRINDPYEEFFVEHSCKSDVLCDTSGILIKERDLTSVPCFLRHICTPIVRAGHQLLVLMKLQDTYNSTTNHANSHCETTSLDEVLPLWRDFPNDSTSCFCNLTLSNKDSEAMSQQREIAYTALYDKLCVYFEKLKIGVQPTNKTEIPYGECLFYSDEGLLSNYEVISVLSENLPSSSSSTDELSSRNVDFTDSDSFTSDDSLSCTSPMKTLKDSVPAFTKDESDDSFVLNFLHEIPFKSIKFPDLVSQSCDGTESTLQLQSPSGNMGSSVISPAGTPKSSAVKSVSMISTMPFAKWMNSTPNYNGYSYPISAIQEDEVICSKPVERERLRSEKPFSLGDSKSEQSAENDTFLNFEVMNQTLSLKSSYDLSRNPVIARFPWLHGTNHSQSTFLPYFDFSSLEDPSQAFSRRILCPSKTKEQGAVENHKGDGVATYEENESGFDTSATVRAQTCTENFVGGLSERVSGGGGWERSMMHSCCDSRSGSNGQSCYLDNASDLPIDFAVDKCIVQGIMHQYAYISNFTLMLLDKGFDLHGHLSALRRFYFMELADWADSFLALLCSHIWTTSSLKNFTTEMQRFLMVALQKSSCEHDPYQERLYIYDKGQSDVALSFSSIGSFDLIGLGYKVEWPINIILTEDALKAYSKIFCFLMEVRLGMFSLSSVWHPLKALEDMGNKEARRVKIFLAIRQGINHFVSSLQHYLQSQLSDVSWCGFLLSLKQQVHDIMDLESMHMTYLADALNACFLSSGSEGIAIIIKNILQCALDLKACLKVNPPEVNSVKALEVQLTFERNLRELYLLYLRSPKHSEFSLCRFWAYLDYNGYYSNRISHGRPH